MIRVACPHCQRRYRTRTEGMGKTAVCTGCHQTFRIGQVRLPFEWKQTDLGEDSWIGVEAPKEKKELRNCIICQAPLDKEVITCPECGANQVTGIVRRPQPRPVEVKPSVLSALPWKLIAGVTALAMLSIGGYRLFKTATSTALDTGERAAHMATARLAAEHLRKGGDESSLAAEFAGRVDDENLPIFLDMLSAGRQDIRQAAVMLIGCGNVTDLRPILEMIGSAAGREQGLAVLEAIGPRRLVALSNRQEAHARRAAAEGLCMLSGLKPQSELLNQLAEKASPEEKITRLNRLCRPYPAATGRFSVTINDTTAPFVAIIEQIGTWFFMKLDKTEFHTEPRQTRTFEIPIDRWCAATGVALDAAAIRRMLAGSVRLVSPIGASWQGTVTVSARIRLDPPLPGFLPIDPPAAGQTAEAEITLTRIP